MHGYKITRKMNLLDYVLLGALLLVLLVPLSRLIVARSDDYATRACEGEILFTVRSLTGEEASALFTHKGTYTFAVRGWDTPLSADFVTAEPYRVTSGGGETEWRYDLSFRACPSGTRANDRTFLLHGVWRLGNGEQLHLEFEGAAYTAECTSVRIL